MAKPTDDFDWPPKGDEVSIYELGPDPWQKLQDASREAFVARQRDRSQTPQPQQPQQLRQPLPQQLRQPRQPQPARPAEPAPEPTRKLVRIVTASLIVAAALGWAIQAATAPSVPVQSFHHPAPAAPTPPPPRITVVATYPVEADAETETTAAPASTTPPGN